MKRLEPSIVAISFAFVSMVSFVVNARSAATRNPDWNTVFEAI